MCPVLFMAPRSIQSLRGRAAVCYAQLMIARLLSLVGAQLVTLVAQLAYVYAFRDAYGRQAATLRARPLACAAAGSAAAMVWTLLGYGVFNLSSAGTSALALAVMTVPAFLVSATGSAVSLGLLTSLALRWDIDRKPYRCVLAGQAAAI